MVGADAVAIIPSEILRILGVIRHRLLQSVHVTEHRFELDRRTLGRVPSDVRTRRLMAPPGSLNGEIRHRTYLWCPNSALHQSRNRLRSFFLHQTISVSHNL